MNIPIMKLGKIVINSIFPFFEKSKALELIKKDMLEVTDVLMAKLYDKVKPIFIKDDRQSILEQLEKKPDDIAFQVAANAVINENLKTDKEFYNIVKNVVEEIENSFPQETINSIYNIKGDENQIEQGLHSDGKTENTIDGVIGNKNIIKQG